MWQISRSVRSGRGSRLWVYKQRGAVEREFGSLKHDWALAPLRVCGSERVRLHADLTILTKLARHLARARPSCSPRTRLYPDRVVPVATACPSPDCTGSDLVYGAILLVILVGALFSRWFWWRTRR